MSTSGEVGLTYGNAKSRLAALMLCTLALAACDDMSGFDLGDAFASKPEGDAGQVQEDAEGQFIEEDVEAPDVFSVSEAALWDGRPSLGGVWVAHPDVTEPERVMIRNQTNGQFVVGALFKRERENPGPRLQLSSDAANALDVLAGSPVELSVVALRKERIPVAPPEPEPTPEPVIAAADTVVDDAAAAPAEIEETVLDPVAIAGAAIEAADPTPVATSAASAASETPAIQSTLPVSRLERPYIQVAVFKVEKNAQTVAGQMRSAGMVPTVRNSGSGDNDLWRVVVGPASDVDERATLLEKIKAEGYSDAYPVSN